MSDDPRTTHNIAALESLLPLLECHLEHFGSIVSRAQWVSPPDAAGSPQIPEPDCTGECSQCPDFHTSDCHVRQERWAQEWERMRRSYPVLVQLEKPGGLLDQLMYHNTRYRLAIYFHHIQPWSDWNREQRAMWAAEGVKWLAKRIDWYLPTYTPKGMPEKQTDRVAEAGRLRADGCSHDQIRRELHMAKKDVPALLVAFAKRNGIS